MTDHVFKLMGIHAALTNVDATRVQEVGLRIHASGSTSILAYDQYDLPSSLVVQTTDQKQGGLAYDSVHHRLFIAHGANTNRITIFNRCSKLAECTLVFAGLVHVDAVAHDSTTNALYFSGHDQAVFALDIESLHLHNHSQGVSISLSLPTTTTTPVDGITRLSATVPFANSMTFDPIAKLLYLMKYDGTGLVHYAPSTTVVTAVTAVPNDRVYHGICLDAANQTLFALEEGNDNELFIHTLVASTTWLTLDSDVTLTMHALSGFSLDGEIGPYEGIDSTTTVTVTSAFPNNTVDDGSGNLQGHIAYKLVQTYVAPNLLTFRLHSYDSATTSFTTIDDVGTVEDEFTVSPVSTDSTTQRFSVAWTLDGIIRVDELYMSIQYPTTPAPSNLFHKYHRHTAWPTTGFGVWFLQGSASPYAGTVVASGVETKLFWELIAYEPDVTSGSTFNPFSTTGCTDVNACGTASALNPCWAALETADTLLTSMRATSTTACTTTELDVPATAAAVQDELELHCVETSTFGALHTTMLQTRYFIHNMNFHLREIHNVLLYGSTPTGILQGLHIPRLEDVSTISTLRTLLNVLLAMLQYAGVALDMNTRDSQFVDTVWEQTLFDEEWNTTEREELCRQQYDACQMEQPDAVPCNNATRNDEDNEHTAGGGAQGACNEHRRKKKRKPFRPLNYREKDEFDLYLSDMHYRRARRNLNHDAKTLQECLDSLERARLIAHNIREIAEHVRQRFQQMAQQTHTTLSIALQHACAQTVPGDDEALPDIHEITALKNTLKTHLLDLHNFMSVQFLDTHIALGHDRGTYYPQFAYCMSRVHRICGAQSVVVPITATQAWTFAMESAKLRSLETVKILTKNVFDATTATVAQVVQARNEIREAQSMLNLLCGSTV
jgi:hypothetical protein